MSTIKEVAELFKDGAAKLLPIARKPTDEDLKHLREIMGNLLQAVKLLGGTDAKGLVTTE